MPGGSGTFTDGLLSELQTGFAGGIGQCLDPTMEAKPGAIESHGLHTQGLGTFGDSLAHRSRSIAVLSGFQSLGHSVLHRGRGGNDFVADEYLRVKMLAAAMHRQPGHTQLADVRTGALGTT